MEDVREGTEPGDRYLLSSNRPERRERGSRAAPTGSSDPFPEEEPGSQSVPRAEVPASDFNQRSSSFSASRFSSHVRETSLKAFACRFTVSASKDG